MTEEEQAPPQEEEAPPASSDSDAVQAALAGIPGLADNVGSRPAAPTGADSMNESEGEPQEFGSPKAPVEDSEAVQQALKQLGLQ